MVHVGQGRRVPVDMPETGPQRSRPAQRRQPALTATLLVLIFLAGSLAGAGIGAAGVEAASREASQTVGALAEEIVWLEVLTPWLAVDVNQADMEQGYVERTGLDGILLLLLSNSKRDIVIWASYQPGTPALRREDVQVRVAGKDSLLPEYQTLPEGGRPIYVWARPGRPWIVLGVDVRICNLWEYAGPSVYQGFITFTAVTN
ncbi:MAG: hypothetical protein IMX00_03905 [Limnochordales bacterium]|nr:hypothetical protein [Limnochordales bacterium]